MVCRMWSYVECTNVDRYIYPTIVNRMNMVCDVDSQSQHPFMVACLVNAVSLWGNTSITIVLLMQSIRFVCKFNMRGDFYPHPGVRSPPEWTNSFYVFTCHCWSCVLYISVTDGVCTGKCFLTEIYSDTQLMQKYRDISLKGGLLTPCYPNYTGLVDEIGIPKRKLFA